MFRSSLSSSAVYFIQKLKTQGKNVKILRDHINGTKYKLQSTCNLGGVYATGCLSATQ